MLDPEPVDPDGSTGTREEEDLENIIEINWLNELWRMRRATLPRLSGMRYVQGQSFDRNLENYVVPSMEIQIMFLALP